MGRTFQPGDQRDRSCLGRVVVLYVVSALVSPAMFQGSQVVNMRRGPGRYHIFCGRGTAVGVLVAAHLLMIIQNAMNHLQVSAYWQYVLTGALTLVAVAIYASREEGTWLRKLMLGLRTSRAG